MADDRSDVSILRPVRGNGGATQPAERNRNEPRVAPSMV
jgi:hypothetical protein